MDIEENSSIKYSILKSLLLANLLAVRSCNRSCFSQELIDQLFCYQAPSHLIAVRRTLAWGEKNKWRWIKPMLLLKQIFMLVHFLP